MTARDSPSILHADLDAFFASVEQRDDPALRGRPVVVGVGVVMCASYEARAFGIRSAMGGVEARRRCPDTVFVPPRLEAYTAASRAVFEVFEDTTPEVEGISVDEAFLDVGGLRRIAGEPAEIAARLRRDVRARVDLPITVGAATTKHVAKVASRAAKPDGLLVVPAGEELTFLHPLPVQALWGVGPATTAKLHARGLRTVGDLAQVDEGSLVAMLGLAAGHKVHALANDRDPRQVRPRQRRRSIGSQRAMGWRPKTAPDIEGALMGLVDRVGRRLRAADRVGRTVVLRLRFEDWGRVTRSHTLARPTANTAVLLEAARHLLAEAGPLIGERGCTLVGVTVANLGDASAVQLVLPFDRWAEGRLDATIDAVRDRFGSAAIGRTALVRVGAGTTVPLLPDERPELPGRPSRDYGAFPSGGSTMGPELYISPRGENDLLVVIAGDVDDTTRLEDVLERRPVRRLVVDASGVTFAGSSFLAWLIRARDEAGLVLRDVSPAVDGLLTVTGMTEGFLEPL